MYYILSSSKAYVPLRTNTTEDYRMVYAPMVVSGMHTMKSATPPHLSCTNAIGARSTQRTGDIGHLLVQCWASVADVIFIILTNPFINDFGWGLP